MRTITPCQLGDRSIQVPGSKSYSHRMLIAAAMARGRSTLANVLDSEDIRMTRAALQQMGATVTENGGTITVDGVDGRFKPCPKPIYLANSGTSMRLLAGVAAVGEGDYTLTGNARMNQRPIRDLLAALRQIDVAARAINASGCPPVMIPGGAVRGGSISIDCSTSSQYLSALLLMAPVTRRGLQIGVTGGPVSRPYIDMTVDVMTRMGITVKRDRYAHFNVAGGQTYRAGDYGVEPDCSQAGYFWAAAAITGACITVTGIAADTRQGDVNFTRVLEQMGCRIDARSDGIAINGGDLRGVEVDMGDMPDLAPTLAVVAAFARGTTVMHNVAHLKAKECDRLSATATELGKMCVETVQGEDRLTVIGGQPRGAEIETYDDHRMAMSFAVAGLRVKGMVIRNEACVAKSFPTFWDVFESLY